VHADATPFRQRSLPGYRRAMTRVLFRGIGWALAAAIVVFSLSPIELRPATTAPADIERLMAFAAMGGAFCIGYPRHRSSIALLVLGAIGLLEIAQQLVPGRHGEIHDGFVKASGAFLGAVAALVVDRHKRAP
jgi:hypothetical protein